MTWFNTIVRGIAAAGNVDLDRLGWDAGYRRNVVGFLRTDDDVYPGDVLGNLNPGPNPIYPEPMQKRLGEQELEAEKMWRNVNSVMRAIARTCDGCDFLWVCQRDLVDIALCPNRARFDALQDRAAAAQRRTATDI